jgi:L-amino acid N-acyltransferase YncA
LPATVDLTLRAAGPGDAAAVAAIYNQGIEDREATFDTRPREAADCEGLIERAVVAELEGSVVGWAAAHPYSDRCVYEGVAEASVYVERGTRGMGAGRLLLEELCHWAEERGYWKLVGRLFPANAASMALVERCGFRTVGLHLRHGRLDGDWRDVVLVERLLGEAAE